MRTAQHDTASVGSFWFFTVPLRAVPFAAAGVK